MNDTSSPYVDPGVELAAALCDGAKQAQAEIEHALRHSTSPKQNGWNVTYHAFDYNLDFFEIGALDDPEWKLLVEPRDRYLLRTLAGRGRLWGNHGYEAAYAMVYEAATEISSTAATATSCASTKHRPCVRSGL